jgi:chloramphenicol 3-O phosphotransferase
MDRTGWVVILNGAPRSGKSTVAEAIQASFDGIWMHMGVDVFAGQVTPPRLRPGMGLRPGGELPHVEAYIPALYGAFYDSVAAHSRHGLNVVVDIGHHNAYSRPVGTLHDAAMRLNGLPALLVGVRCPVDVIMQRRARVHPGREGYYVTGTENEPLPAPVLRWQVEVHRPGLYDMEIDTSVMTPPQCAAAIKDRLAGPAPTALAQLAAIATAP